MKYNIDASGRTIGRVATEAAHILRGKNLTTFERNEIPPTKVTVINASKLKISENKKNQKTYSSYTGYPGGLKKQILDNRLIKKGHSDVLKTAIIRMLPRNKLRSKILKNLEISN